MPLCCVQLPVNLCAESNTKWKTQYWDEYCSRANKRMLAQRKSKRVKTKPLGELPLNRTFMKDHYPEFGNLKLKEDYEDLLVTLGTKCNLNERTEGLKQTVLSATVKQDATVDKPLSQTLPETIKAVENSWTQEVHSNKRERGNMYGTAGKKTDLSRPKTCPQTRKMPGVDSWLNTANEYEKQVVYTFLDSVSRGMDNSNETEVEPVADPDEALQDSKRVRVSSAPTHIQRYTPVPSSHGSRASTASSHSSRGSSPDKRLNLDFDPGKASPRNGSSPQKTTRDQIEGKPERRASSETGLHETITPELEQKPLSARSSRAQSSRDFRRTRSFLKHDHSHGEIKCVKCRDNLINSLIKDMEKNEISPQFPGMKTPPRNSFRNTSAYYAFDPDDYVHQRSLFTNAPKGDRGHFIIHPDWVSEYSKTRPSYR